MNRTESRRTGSLHVLCAVAVTVTVMASLFTVVLGVYNKKVFAPKLANLAAENRTSAMLSEQRRGTEGIESEDDYSGAPMLCSRREGNYMIVDEIPDECNPDYEYILASDYYSSVGAGQGYVSYMASLTSDSEGGNGPAVRVPHDAAGEDK